MREEITAIAALIGLRGAWNKREHAFWIHPDLRGSAARTMRDRLGVAHDRIYWAPDSKHDDALKLAVRLGITLRFELNCVSAECKHISVCTDKLDVCKAITLCAFKLSSL